MTRRAVTSVSGSSRLFAALVATCDEKGYDATSVEDLLRTSGVSRATFYEQFDDKLDSVAPRQSAVPH